MNRQTKTSAYLAGVLLAGLALVPLAGQTRSPAVGEVTYTPPRTPWGDPDLQGIWPSTHMVGVPFERPDQFGNRLYLTDAEFKTRQDDAEKQKALDVLDFDITKPPAEIVALGDVGNTTSPPPHWLERGEPSRQSSLIVEPANGKAPPMTTEGQARQKLAKTTYIQQTGFTRPDELGPYDRCISRGRRRLDDPGCLQQRKRDCPGARLCGASQRDDPRIADHPARRTARAPCLRRSSRTWAAPAVDGTATPWSSGRPTSTDGMDFRRTVS